MAFTEWVQVFDQLRHGEAGIAVLMAGWLASNAAVFVGARRIYRTRPTTHALLGGEGRFAVQGPRDIDDLFRMVDRSARRLSETSGDPAMARLMAQKMIGECRELFQLNIAFRTNRDRQVYLDRIRDRCDQAERGLRAAQQALRDVA